MTFLSVLLAFLLTPQTLQTPNSNPNLIEDVRPLGNRRVPSNTIKYQLQTKAGDTLNPATIARDIKALVAMSQFDDVRVEEEQGQKGLIVTFVVKEKPTIRTIEYKGLKTIAQSDVLDKFREKKLGLSQQSIFDQAKIRRAQVLIKSLLAEKGHQDARVDATTAEIPGTNAVALTFDVEEGPKVKIEKIDFQGNTILSDRQLKHAMKLVKESSPLTVFTGKDSYHDEKLAYDLNQVRILYGEHGYAQANFLDPEVEIRPTKISRTLPFIKLPFPFGIPLPVAKKTVNRYYVTVKIEENAQYKVGEVKVTGAKEFNPLLIQVMLGLAPGTVYNESQLRKGFDNVKKLYGSRGYINFTPVPDRQFDDEKKIVNLTINIDEDRQFLVNRISFSGNTTTRDKVIRREVLVQEGSVFNSALWDLSVLRLNQLGYFDKINEEDGEVKPNAIQPQVDITLKVKEKARNSIGFSGGISGIGGASLGLNYETNNFLGFGETLSANVQGGTRQSNVVFSFTEPYFRDRPISLGLSIFAQNYKYDQARELFGLNPATLPTGLGFENRLNYQQKRSGFTATASYPLRLFQRFGITYQFDNSQTSAVNPATEAYFQSITTQQQGTFVGTTGGSFSASRARKIIPNYSWSTVDSPQYPSKGQALNATLDFTGRPLGGNVNFYRPTVEYRYYRPSTKHRNVIAMRFLGGYVHGFNKTNVPFYERSFMGGEYDIRGFDIRSLSPISFLTRMVDQVDPETGNLVKRPFDDIVYVGGDTSGLLNLEYRIPIVGNVITVSPFLDAGNTWVMKKNQLTRQVVDSDGVTQYESPKLLGGTNSGVRASMGFEVGVVMPVINAPFRLIFAFNPERVHRTYVGPTTGLPFTINEPKHMFKFSVGRTF